MDINLKYSRLLDKHKLRAKDGKILLNKGF
jgi:hypothetical protein